MSDGCEGDCRCAAREDEFAVLALMIVSGDRGARVQRERAVVERAVLQHGPGFEKHISRVPDGRSRDRQALDGCAKSSVNYWKWIFFVSA